jgi:hypothetical protein
MQVTPTTVDPPEGLKLLLPPKWAWLDHSATATGKRIFVSTRYEKVQEEMSAVYGHAARLTAIAL